MPDSSPLDVKELMDPWVLQMGFPLLTVTNSYDGTAAVTSSRFFNPANQNADTPSDFKYLTLTNDSLNSTVSLFNVFY